MADCCPHCGLPNRYFSSQGLSVLTQPARVSESASSYNVNYNEELFEQFIKEYNRLLLTDQYIPSSDIKYLYSKYFPGSNDVNLQVLNKYFKEIEEHNDQFIKTKLAEYKTYFDELFTAIDKSINLDEDQRKAILADEDHCLIIAGAGAGKTTTMAGKVKYLIEKMGVATGEIIVISYTNKAIDELKERINDKLGIPVKILTFHAFGYEIIRNSTDERFTVNYKSFDIIYNFLNQTVFNDNNMLAHLILFLGYYFDIPDDIFKFKSINEYSTYKANLDYETLKSRLGEFIQTITDQRSRANRTITGEFLRSGQEVQIANFLYLHNIDYEYEKPYKFNFPNSKKLYTPDFFIKQDENECFIEHFGISEDFKDFDLEGKTLEKYQKSVLEKKRLHKSHNTNLITTWSRYNDSRSLLVHLREELEKMGFVLNKRDDTEVYKRIQETNKEKYIYKLVIFIIQFIENYKTCGYGIDDFNKLRQKTKNVRTLLFLDIVEKVFLFYQEELKKQNSIDFADMINDAEKILNDISDYKEKVPYKYIIIDEFQDIAKQRYNLTKKLADVTGAKVVAVGDDWQSIFAFAGSDITLFTKFLELMGSGKELIIKHTYRNAQKLIDIAGGFVQKNSSQIKKSLISIKNIDNPVVVRCYDDSSNIRKNWIATIEDCISEIINKSKKGSSILIIGRYNFDKKMLTDSERFIEKSKDKIICSKHPKADITFLTAHSSKGLGFDNVILINMIEGKFGFPSQIEDDPILKLVTYTDYAIPFAEERRLFYVALTRTKNRVYLITPQQRPSRFVLELINDYKVPYDKQINKGPIPSKSILCPICKMPLKYENNKNYGLRLYMCTNEPEI
ncbi:MAG: UvrD-helicase domain-containing protein, partial [Acidobacteria bacterium]|nr:UvrD-helicase domain-containing protein [Acidobacteriota bacterium]